MSYIHITPKACISFATCCGISSDQRSGYHQAAGGCTLTRDEIQPRRGWWYAPHFARRWYAKPAAWITKKELLVDKSSFFGGGEGGISPSEPVCGLLHLLLPGGFAAADRCTSSLSLFRPQDAVVLGALTPPALRFKYILTSKKTSILWCLFFGA